MRRRKKKKEAIVTVAPHRLQKTFSRRSVPLSSYFGPVYVTAHFLTRSVSACNLAPH